MAHENVVPSDAEDLIDWLIGIQQIANEILDGKQKIQKVRYSLAALPIAPLLDQQFYIDCALLFSKSPGHAPDERTMYPNGMAFTGTLVGVNYLQDYAVPIDCLTVNFGEPSVVDPDTERCAGFKEQTFQVPVMAIDSHVSLSLLAD